jgi:peptide-methionine (R)-S-oxide reductase
VVIENFSAAGKSLGKASVPRVVKSDDEWRALLPEAAFYVTRHEGTERPFSGQYDNHHANGLYRCICCETALFDSGQVDSGTGWRSFRSRSANVSETRCQLLMARTAVSCRRCDAHLGLF